VTGDRPGPRFPAFSLFKRHAQDYNPANFPEIEEWRP